jgi:uncharacterized protein YlzI (FlbEa/FlbD family)
MMLRYEIRPGKISPCELVAIEQMHKGPDITVLIAGTYTECQRVLNHIEHYRRKLEELRMAVKKTTTSLERLL